MEQFLADEDKHIANDAPRLRGEHGQPISVSADLLYRGVEIVTCAQREESYEKLCEQLREKGLHQEGLQWYLECFRYGMPPHQTSSCSKQF